MPFVKVGALSGLPAGQMLEAILDEERYVVCNVDGTLHSISGFCPHSGGPLGQGALHGEVVVCPWHGWEFNCRTGENPGNANLRVTTYPVKMDGDDILIDIPAEK